MDVLRRRTTVGRLVRPVSHSRLVRSLADVHPPKAVKSGLAALGGLVGLTAGSAAVSARRRRSEGSSDDS
jgi:hypothetical protein